MVMIINSLIRDGLTFSNRRACCLDADVKRNDRNNHILCQMGQGRQSIGLACSNNDRPRSGTDRCTRNCVPAEPDPPLHVACAMRDQMPFHNKPVSGFVGKDQGLGDDR